MCTHQLASKISCNTIVVFLTAIKHRDGVMALDD